MDTSERATIEVSEGRQREREGGEYGMEDVDPRESLEELRGYEGVVEGSTWVRAGAGSRGGDGEGGMGMDGEGGHGESSQSAHRPVGSSRDLEGEIDQGESSQSALRRVESSREMVGESSQGESSQSALRRVESRREMEGQSSQGESSQPVIRRVISRRHLTDAREPTDSSETQPSHPSPSATANRTNRRIPTPPGPSREHPTTRYVHSELSAHLNNPASSSSGWFPPGVWNSEDLESESDGRERAEGAPWRSLYTLGNENLDVRLDEEGGVISALRGNGPRGQTTQASAGESYNRRGRNFGALTSAEGTGGGGTDELLVNPSRIIRGSDVFALMEDTFHDEDLFVPTEDDMPFLQRDGGDDGLGSIPGVPRTSRGGATTRLTSGRRNPVYEPESESEGDDIDDGLATTSIVREPSLSRGGNNMRRRGLMREILHRARGAETSTPPTEPRAVHPPPPRVGLQPTNLPISTIPEIRSTSGSRIPARDGRLSYGDKPTKRRRLDSPPTPASSTPRPAYLSHSTLSPSVPLPGEFQAPTKTSRLALTLHTPSSTSSSTSPNSQPQPCISFTTHPTPTRTDSDATALRTIHPIPPGIGCHYYEIKILDSGPEGYMSLGWVKEKVDMRRLVGWEKGTWGWHADDGRAFEGSGMGAVFGPGWGVGDILGAGIDFTTRRAFFTKNGEFIGHVFKNLPLSGLYPAIGLRNPRESIAVNFHGPFKYEIEAHITGIKQGILLDLKSRIPFNIPALSTLSPKSPIDDKSEIEKRIDGITITETILPLRQAVPIPIPTSNSRSTAALSGSTSRARQVSTIRPTPAPDNADRTRVVAEALYGRINTATPLPTPPSAMVPTSEPVESVLEKESPFTETASKAKLALVLDYLGHKGMDNVKAHLLRDLGKRRIIPARASTEGVSASANIDTLCEGLKKGEILDLEKVSPDLNKGIWKKIKILNLISVALSNIGEEIDESAMEEGKKLLASTKDISLGWTGEEVGWVNEAVALVCGIDEKNGKVWEKRRGEWAEELRSWLRGKEGLKSQSYLEQTLRHSHALIQNLSEVDGAGAFVNMKEYLDGYGMKDVEGKGKGREVEVESRMEVV